MSQNTATSPEQVTHQAVTDGIDCMQGESVLQNRRPSWTLWWKQIGFAALAALVSLTDGAVGGLILGGLVFAYVVFSRAQSRYVVTDERIKGKIGVISSKTIEDRIEDLRSLATSQRLFERVVSHGSLEFQAGANNKLVWHGVTNHDQVAKSVRTQMRER
jgi:Bacterial membrane flanked domain.